MIIRVTTGAVDLQDADDFSRLALRVNGPVALSSALGTAGAGSYDGEYAWIRIDWLVAMVTSQSGEAARIDGIESMVAFARARSWVSPDGRAVRVHLEGP